MARGRHVGLAWQDATVVALGLLTSSTGSIIDSLERCGLEPGERFAREPDQAT